VATVKPLRVVVVCGVSYLGGGELALLRLLERLPAERCQARVVIVAASGGGLEPELWRLGLRVDVLPVVRTRHLGAGLRALAALARIARGADLLHANDVRAALWCQLAALLARRPWTWHVRDLVSGAHRFEHVARVLRPTRCIAISSAVKRALLAFGPWEACRVDVVLHGVDAAALAAQADRAAFRAEMGLAEDDLAVGIVGRLIAWKGQEDFVRAAALVAPRAPNARFYVVGGIVTDPFTGQQVGDELARLRRLASELGLNGRITFTGLRADVASVMAGLDVLVLASHAEPFGLVLLEAMSQGTAVVATAAGGAEEVVLDGQTGLLVPPRNPPALAAALERLLADPARVRALGAAGRERVRTAFTLEREVDQVVQTWERATGRR